jgi:hypothetical protein
MQLITTRTKRGQAEIKGIRRAIYYVTGYHSSIQEGRSQTILDVKFTTALLSFFPSIVSSARISKWE